MSAEQSAEQARFQPNPDQPDRCPSMDPYDSGLQCTRLIHEDDDCHAGGIAWKKGTPRYLSDREKALALADQWDAECAAGCLPRNGKPNNAHDCAFTKQSAADALRSVYRPGLDAGQ